MKRIALSSAVVLLIGCAGSSAAPPRPAANPPASISETSTSMSFRLDDPTTAATATAQADLEQVWAQLPLIYRELGIEAEVYDPVARVYGTRRFARNRIAGRQPAEFVRCGNEASGPSAMSAYRVRLSILTTLRAAGERATQLSTEVSGSASTVEGTSTSAARCVTTGELERRIHRLVIDRLAG